MTATPHHRRAVGWRLPAACAALLILMLVSGRYTLRLGFRHNWLSLEAGCLTATWVKHDTRHIHWPWHVGGVFANRDYRIRWLPARREHLNLRYLDLPLWIPIPLLLALGTGLWLRDRRRARLGCCPACAYDLVGNTSGVCPECGAPAHPFTPSPLHPSHKLPRARPAQEVPHAIPRRVLRPHRPRLPGRRAR